MLTHQRIPMPRYQVLLCVVLGVLVAGATQAQTPLLRTLTLPSAVREIPITTLAQDGSGTLWMGGAASTGVLLSYDGFGVHRQLPDAGLPSVNVTALYADTDGALWVGLRNGKISRHTSVGFVPYVPEEGEPASAITAFLRDSRGYLWYGTNMANGDGIYFDTGTRVYTLLPEGKEGLPNNAITCLLEDSTHSVWAGTDGGLVRLEPDGDKHFKVSTSTQSNGLPDNLVRGLALGAGNTLWIAMQDSGLVAYNPSQRRFDRVPNWRFGSVQQLVAGKNDELWLATSTGLVRYNTKLRQFARYTEAQGMPGASVRAVLYDRENTLWAATPNGLGHLLGERFEFYSQADGLLSPNVNTLFNDSRGDYWIGTTEGITRYTTNRQGETTVKTYLNDRSLKREARSIVAIAEDTKGAIWAGSFGGGVFRIDPKTGAQQHYQADDGIGDQNVISIAPDAKGNLWLGTLGGGITYVELQSGTPRFTNYTSAKGLGGDYVYHVFVARDGAVWVSTDGAGVTRFKDGKFRVYTAKDSFPAQTAYRTVEDASGNVFVLTPSHGVQRLVGERFAPYPTLDLSEGQVLNFLVADKAGHLVVGTENRIGLFDLATGTGKVYDENDGLAGFEPNLNAAFCDKNGMVWLGTTRGIVRYNPTSKSPSDQPPPVVLTRLRVFDKDQPLSAGLRLASDEDNLTFDFSALNLAIPSRVRYQYRLLGQDSTWSLPTQSRFVTFPNLTFGSYTFQVRASINEGQWCTPAQYAFVIRPPFYLTWYFLTGSVLLLAFGTYRFFRWRIERVERENLVLEQKVDERTREVVAQKEVIEKKNTEIEAKNKDITESIVYASRIQQAILPETARLNGKLRELMVFYKAKDIVSGDFYWFEQQNNRSYIAAVDCTGHGVPGALLSVMGYNLLNQIVYQHPTYTPEQVLHALDHGIYEALRRKMNTDQPPNDGMDVALCCIDHATNKLYFSAALRPLYYIENGQVHEVKGSRYPIGGGYEGKEFELHTFDITPGCTFYIFSDGLVDQFGGPNGRKFTPGRLKKLLEEYHTLPLPEQERRIEAAFNDWQGTQEQIDDVMLIGFRPL
ncbi:MAG: two-component regulator propeller domain-containing protein [Bacteroidia bacterium]|nr:two-component regulator propeller domain-containing protein [Bacteroidia bacterium]